MARRRFTRLHAPDPRDQKHLVRARKLTGRKHWPEGPWNGDQESTPHCVGYAWAHWLSGAPINQFLGPNAIYKHANQNDEWKDEPHDGTSVRAGAEFLDECQFIQEYQWAFDVDTLTSALLVKGPVVMGTNWYARMDDVDSKGIFTVGGRNLGGHAYLVSGVDTYKELFRVKNSWGTLWGLPGSRGFIRFDDMARLLSEDGEAACAIERKVAPL